MLVHYYVSRCSYCVELAPVFQKLADLYKGGEKIVFAELNHALNDIGVVTNYLTIILFPSDGSDSIHFDQENSLEAMVNSEAEVVEI